MNITFSASFEARTIDEVKQKALQLYREFLGQDDLVELPYNAAVQVTDGVAQFSVSTRLED